MFPFICNVLKRIPSPVCGPCSRAWRIALERVSRAGGSIHRWLLCAQAVKAGVILGSRVMGAEIGLLQFPSSLDATGEHRHTTECRIIATTVVIGTDFASGTALRTEYT